MLLYVSGQMSNMPEHNFPAFFEAERQLVAAGYEVLNPAQQGIIDGWEWKDYLKHDLQDVLKADGIATLRGWRKSRGARLEVHVGTQLGLTVQTVACWARMAELAVPA
ncbi:DUF4406 domain-containing protein [Amycolatopsis kentuckyensis]|uniref:DUF4406 domain-containing protein n=1 Tax=Amycolatopsis kentuckyensis TaxID=218823 RepID=UPI000A38D855|nr:DUF4406 domain-containing protein [Amycolatopsis kentuckyensis]